MTGKPEIDRYGGMTGYVHVIGDLYMAVTVIDVRQAYGRIDILVAPTTAKSGQGSAWVSVNKLQQRRAA